MPARSPGIPDASADTGAGATADPSAPPVPAATRPCPPCPAGFVAAGGTCGIKPSGRPDLAVLLAEPGPASVAAVFTRNLVQAAPVLRSRARLEAGSGHARILVINSGNANAATGPAGERDADAILDAARDATRARGLDCADAEALGNSTGLIGARLPVDRITGAIPGLVAAARPDGLADFAEAIRTTDTFPKTAERVIDGADGPVRVVGVAKGAGMIHPDMATMIAVLLTDAVVAPDVLDRCLRAACDRSFHRISVDGDTSTNDSVFAFASGAAGAVDEAALTEALSAVARELAILIVHDGEGASHVLMVRARGAADGADALAAARTVATSMLVRTAVTGGDPNWGRLLAALGRSGASFDPSRCRIAIGGVDVYADGEPRGERDAPDLRAAMAAREVHIEIDLGAGDAEDEFIASDITTDYIRFNSEYTT